MLKNIIIFALFANFAKAQNLNRFWIFGDSCGIDFANPNFPLPIQSGMDGQGSCSNIADNNGKLKLYTWNQSGIDDSVSTIYNRNDTVVKNGTRLCGGDLYNQNVIIPLNKFDTAYYIFHQGILTTDGLYFTKIIFNSTDSLGIVTSKNNNILQHRLGDCLTAVKHGNGRDWWIITKYSDFNSPNFYNRFFAFQQVQDSLYLPLIQDFNDATDVDFQKIIWHPSYNKFMLINLRGYIAEFNFDRCTGLITKNKLFSSEFIPGPNTHNFFWHGAYSKNGNIFYASTTSYFSIMPKGYLLQFNLLDSNPMQTVDTIDTWDKPIGTGALLLAPDDKIYFTRAYESQSAFFTYPYADTMRNYINENLSVINEPDSLGVKCDYQPFSFYLGGKRTYYGLPNNPNYELGPLVGSPCDTLSALMQYTPKSPLGDLKCTYISSWQKLFVNARGVKGKNVTVTIYDVNGNAIYSKGKPLNGFGVHSGYVTLDVDCAGWSAGMYVVSLQSEQESLSVKFVKE